MMARFINHLAFWGIVGYILFSKGWITCNLNCNGDKIISDITASADSLKTQIAGFKRTDKVSFSTEANAAEPPPEPTVTKYFFHVVKQGETLLMLDEKYNVSWRDIKEFNGIINENELYPGRTLKIPAIFKHG